MNQPQITPGSNGYQSTVAIPDYGPNPWSGMIPGDSQAAQTGVQQGLQNLQGQAQGMTDYANLTSPYPTFPNSAGLGSQSAFGQVSQASAPPMAAPQSSDVASALSESSSRGGNPWSFKGEAMSR